MKKFIQQLRKDERGLTLVELLAVVVILGIIATIAFVSIGNVIKNSKEDAHISNAMQLISAAKLEEASSSQGFPDAGYSTLVADTEANHLSTIDGLTNPWDAEDENYGGVVSKDDEGVYSVTMSGKADTIKLDITEATESELAKGRDGNLSPTATATP